MAKAKWFDTVWWAFIEACGGKCPRCGRVCGHYDKDHIVPAYQGGQETLSNLQPLCAWCNSSKGPEKIDWRPEGWHVKFIEILKIRLEQELKNGG